MAEFPYLTRTKRGIWGYRRGVPTHLRKLIGKREFLKSFGAADRDEIILDYHIFAAETDEALSRAQQEYDEHEEDRLVEEQGGYTIINDMIPELLGEATSDPVHMCGAPQDLAAACDRHYQWCKGAEQAYRFQTTKRVNADPAAFWRGEIIPLPMSQEAFYRLPQFRHLEGTGDGFKYLLAMAYSKRLQDGAVVLRAKLATQDVEAVSDTFGSCHACARKFGLAFVETELRLINDFLTTDAALVPLQSVRTCDAATTVQQPSPHASGPRLSEAVAKWIDENAQGQSAWSRERRALCTRVMHDFIEICGDKGVGEYKKSDGREFVALMRRLPANLVQRKASLGFEGKGLYEVAEVAALRGLPSQDDSNTNKKVGIVDQCFAWLMSHYDECLSSPVKGMKIVLKRSVKEEKDPFTIDQLNAIFAAPVFVGCGSERNWSQPGSTVLRQSAKFWVPLIALFSGMRSGEICQLTSKHIREHQGVHYFALTSELRLKNSASVRSVPVHRTLVECGFLDLVTSRDGVLFPDLTQHASGRWSDAFGKHFARFLKSLVIKSDGLDFHSFRHTFIAGAEGSGVEFTVRERLAGHALQGQAGRYDQSYKQEQADMQLMLVRNRELQKLQYNGLQIAHLCVR